MSALGDLLRAGQSGAAEGGLVSKLRAQRTVWGSRNDVGNSPDLERIISLPRRKLEPPPAAHWEYVKRNGCGDASCPFFKGLKPIQSAALYEIQQNGGAIVWAGVGAGKFGIAALAGEVLGAKTTVLLVPPSAKPQVLKKDLPHWQSHFRVPNCLDTPRWYTDTDKVLHVVSYSQLSSPKQADILDRLKPDLIVADESHSVKATSAARTKRFRRSFKGRDVKLVALSGTPGWSIKHQWHLCSLALGAGSPLPRAYPVVEEWAWALDPSDFQAGAGELSRLAVDGVEEDVEVSYRKRFLSTPGVICTQEPSVGTPLNIHRLEPQVPADVEKHLQKLRDDWETPGGEKMQDAIVFWQHARELACGMYLRWIWPQQEPQEIRTRWLMTRKAYFSEVRDFLTHRARSGADSPFLYSEAVRAGKIQSEHWGEWQEVKDTAKPETEPVWLSDFLLEAAAQWASEHAGIIWYEVAAVGERLAKLANLPLYGGGTKASTQILSETGKRSIVASIDAHHQSKNLQQFKSMLFLAPMSSDLFEQAIGRSHRQGQDAAVDVWLCLHTPEFQKTFEGARKRAAHVFKRDLAPQKILYGSYSFPVVID